MERVTKQAPPLPADQPARLPALAEMPDRSVTKVTLFGGAVIVFAILLVGWLVYAVTQREAVDKLKTKDLLHLADSIAAKVDGQIRKAKETSLLMAEDPNVINWVAGGERDEALGAVVGRKLTLLTSEHGYDNSFLVSAVSNRYWGEGGTVLRTMSRSDPEDAWFYANVDNRKPIEIVLDYAIARGDTFVFVNALIGGAERALGETGVGLSLKQSAEQFQQFKYGDKSHLWLVDREGTIYLSDRYEQAGTKLNTILPGTVSDELFAGFANTQVVTYRTAQTGTIDLISRPIESADLDIVFAIPRSESVPFLHKIRTNTLLAVLASLLLIVAFYFYVSRKLADPYKRALRHNEELELKVAERTRELSLKHEQLTDGIAYAKRIQDSVLHSEDVLREAFPVYFAIRQPRDLVGGDFYWAKRVPGGTLAAVADCTGHGVPGAFMTLLAQSLLNRIAEHECQDDPARLLALLNRHLKRTLRQEARQGDTDDGLDIGLLFIGDSHVLYAGARCPLLVVRGGEAEWIEGDRKSVGYRRTPLEYEFANVQLELTDDLSLFLSTDGWYDQNGGANDYSFGRTRFAAIVAGQAASGLENCRTELLQQLREHAGSKEQRDDITVLALQPKRKQVQVGEATR
ncbi:MAG: SpoIIE family protein phosphatase [Paenibacillaceae bacterium]|nr:SpoIIE family protein phosphatase [Paenibacillaceae bacterium]